MVRRFFNMDNDSNNSDNQILAGCISGDRTSQETFVRKFSDPVYRTIQYTLKNKNLHLNEFDIDDLHNTVFIQLFENKCKKLSMFEGKNGCSLFSWIRLITVRTVIDHIRKKFTDPVFLQKKSFTPDVMNELIGKEPTPITLVEKTEQYRILEKGMCELQPRDRLFLKLHCFDGVAIGEVARIIGISVNNAYALKNRAINRLRAFVVEATDYL